MSHVITLTRIYQFSASHRLHASDLSDSENINVYEKCNNLNGHGHDYRIEVSLSGEPDGETGMIMPLEEFDGKVQRVLDQLDYKHLDKEVPFFKTHISTGEIIIRFLWQELERVWEANRLYHLKLWETNNNYFELGNEDFS
jgi:6-pyruvoyltetrahydropterin/6-carboxytetrahydropterin synthase